MTFVTTWKGVGAVARARATRAGPIASSRTRRKASHHRIAKDLRSGIDAADSGAMAGDVPAGDIDEAASAASSTKPTATRRMQPMTPMSTAGMKFCGPSAQIAIAPNRQPTPTNPARTTTTSESTGARRGRSGMRPKQPSNVRTVSHKSPRASTRHSMSQNVVHQRTVPVTETRRQGPAEVCRQPRRGSGTSAPSPGPNSRLTPTRIGQPAPTITANPTLKAIARL